jgi:aspartyl-tRNA(Asn)/glutamyl-tRNA(Gln) amidotransferase subunit C
MAISIDEVRYIARLARLEFTEAEEQLLAEQMSKILDYVAKLNELDTRDVPPMSHVLDLYNVLREDMVEQRITREEALRNAPSADSDYFRVPKVIE